METKDREFIKAIKTNEILWDINHENYKNLPQKQEVWKEIANQFNLPISECKRRWKSLRGTLCRQNLRAREKDLPPGTFSTKWKFAEDMSFLIPIVQKKSGVYTKNRECDNSSICSVESDMETSQLDPIETNNQGNQRKRKSRRSQIPQFIEAVKKRQILWDSSDPNFKCRELRDGAWKEIEYELKISDEDCKKKWNYLKVYLSRECSRHPDNRSSWAYFKQLDFMRPLIEQNISKTSAGQNDPNSVQQPGAETRSDFPEIVIAEVKKYPILWNLYNKNYKSLYKKMKTWRKIADTLGTSVDEVKKKWKALRDIFARSYAKNPDEKTNTWPYFQQMIFLAPFLKSRNLSFAKSFERTQESDDDDSVSSVLWEPDINQTIKTEILEPIKTEPLMEETFRPEIFEAEPLAPDVKALSNEALIEYIKKQPILWDTTFSNYKNVKMRSVAWKVVAEGFGLSVADCRKKWKTLRDLFVRHYLKPIDESQKTWQYYQQMLFLGPQLKDKKDDLLGTRSMAKKNEKELSSSEESQNEEEQSSVLLIDTHVKDFIDLVKQNEILWNPNNKNYKSKERKLQAWESIGKHFGLPETECRKKWKALRDAFCKCYYKPIKEEDKVWKYYTQMKFLIPYLKFKKNTLLRYDSSEEPASKHNDNNQNSMEMIEDDENFSSAFEELDRHDLTESEKYCIADFIEIVRQHEILWDTNNENYRNNEFRMKEWDDIAVHLGVSVEECKKKWKALRDSFVRNYFKPVKEKYKAWNYYTQMKFLGPHVKYKKGKSLVGDAEFIRRNDDSFSSSPEENDETPPSTSKKFTVKEFVNEIKKHTILWDLSDERCKMKKYRLQAWKEISAHFCVSSLECKRKWAILRSAFIREFAKYPDNDTWGNFKELDFLLPYLKANVTANIEVASSETGVSFNDSENAPTGNLHNSFASNDVHLGNQVNLTDRDESWKEQFILAIKQQQILWNTTDCNYRNPLKKQQAWNKIAMEFGLSIDDAKQQWIALKESFEQCLNIQSGEEGHSKWEHYETMEFLRNVTNLGDMDYEGNDSDPFSLQDMTSQTYLPDDKSTLEFIKAVREQQLLWNSAIDDYNDEAKKKETWDEIANKFGLSFAECSQTWMALRNGYTRVILSHSVDKKYSWKYLDEMDFLRPFIKADIDPSNFVEVSQDFGDAIKDCHLAEQNVSKKGDEDDALFEELFEVSPSEFTQNIERSDIQHQNPCESIPPKRRKYSETSSDDEDKNFFQILREQMKGLPRDIKSEAKGHIQAYLKVVAANHSS